MYFYFSSQMKAEDWAASLSFSRGMDVRRVTTGHYKPRKFPVYEYVQATFEEYFSQVLSTESIWKFAHLLDVKTSKCMYFHLELWLIAS